MSFLKYKTYMEDLALVVNCWDVVSSQTWEQYEQRDYRALCHHCK